MVEIRCTTYPRKAKAEHGMLTVIADYRGEELVSREGIGKGVRWGPDDRTKPLKFPTLKDKHVSFDPSKPLRSSSRSKTADTTQARERLQQTPRSQVEGTPSPERPLTFGA